MTYEKVVIALGSKEKDRKMVLDRASLFVENLKGAEVYVVYVEEDIQFFGAPYGAVIIDRDQALHVQAEKILQEAGAKIGADEEHQLSERGSIRSALLDVTSDLEVDLLIMGCHHLKGWQKLFGGRVDGIISESPCDILAVQLDLDDE